jgi:hypothetical protein
MGTARDTFASVIEDNIVYTRNMQCPSLKLTHRLRRRHRVCTFISLPVKISQGEAANLAWALPVVFAPADRNKRCPKYRYKCNQHSAKVRPGSEDMQLTTEKQ